MAPTTHTETHPLVFGQEVSFGSIAGPTDFLDVYVAANVTKNAIVEWRVYATVGSLVSRVGTSPGGGSVASVLKWSGPQGPYSPLAANGSSYELRAYWAQPGPVPTMKASIVGYDEFDTVADTDASASEQIPASFAEVEFANAVGYSQFADVAVTQQFTGNVNFTLYALAEAGGVEAAVASQPLQNPNDSTTRIFSNLKLPGATSYSLRANNISTTGVGPTIAASLTAYSVGIGSGAITPGPQITVLRSVTPTSPTETAWASSGYVDIVADCGADPTGVDDIAPALDKASVILLALANENPKTALTLFFPPGQYALRSTPTVPTWNFSASGTSLTIEGCGDASVFTYYAGAGSHFPAIVVNRITIQDMAFYGGIDVGEPTADCDYALDLSCGVQGLVQRCDFINIYVALEVVALSGPAWSWRDNFIGDCAVLVGGNACFVANAIETLECIHSRFFDVGQLNGLPSAGKPVFGNVGYLKFFPNGSTCQFIKIEQCVIDELTGFGIQILGTAENPVTRVEIIDTSFNPPVQGSPPGPCITASFVESLYVRGVRIGESIYDVNSDALLAELESVSDAFFDRIQIDPGSGCNIIQADSGCGSLVVQHSTDNLVLSSSAQATSLAQSGYTEPNQYAVTLQAANG